jgi:hypothetical protein
MERWRPKERASKNITKLWSCIEERVTAKERLRLSIASA